jgi:hypothetical protein
MNPVFSHGYCKNHQHLRTDSKYIDKHKDKRLRQYYPVKKVSKKPLFGFTCELEMFHQIWGERPHKCIFTGENLDQYFGTDFWFSCFAHILPKGKFPLFKLNPENVRLVYPEFHSIVDQGTKDDQLKHLNWDFQLWDDLVQEMKSEYIIYMKENLLK